MKKVLLSIIFMFVSLNCLWGENQIQNVFYNCEIGKTTKDVAKQNFNDSGFELKSDSVDILIYTGPFLQEGLSFSRMMASFINDTLSAISFAEDCNESCKQRFSQFKNNLKNKYNNQIPDAIKSRLGSKYKEDNYMLCFSNKTVLIAFMDSSALVCTYADAKLVDALSKVSTFYDKAYIVTGVAGVNFGESESVVKSKLEARFGDFTADNNSITFVNPTIGDVLYDYAVFYFKYNKSTKQKELVAASLSKHFYTWNYDDAKMFYNSVTSRYSSKYINELDLSENKNLLKLYGSITEDYSMPPITISLSKGVSRGGDSYYYVTVNYYSGKTEDLYHDDI